MATSNQIPIHWYPSHMAAAEKALREALPRVDVVIEVLDARLPRSSSNPVLAKLAAGKPRIAVLAKADLADDAATKAWCSALQVGDRARVTALVASDVRRAQTLLGTARTLVPSRGTGVAPLRLMVAGVPNVGKSTLINALVKRRLAKVGGEPGITKGQKWIRLDANTLLSDTPGLLWPKIDDVDQGYRLAASGAVRDTSLEETEVAKFALQFLCERYPKRLRERYRLETPDLSSAEPGSILKDIGRRRGCLVKGGEVELTKAAQLLLNDLRGGALGKITFELP